MCDIELENIPHHTLNLLDPWITEFKHMLTIFANEVVMLLVSIGFLEPGNIFTKLMLGYQIGFQQKFDGVIDRCSANPVPFFLHMDEEKVNIKMFVHGIDFFQDQKTLCGLSLSILFKIVGEDFLDFCFYSCC